MKETGKSARHSLAAARALVENDPFLNEVDGRMLAQCAVCAACVIASIAILLFAVKGWVVTWC